MTATTAVIADYRQEIVTAKSGERPSALQLGATAASRLLTETGVPRSRIGALFTGRSPQAYMALQYNHVLLNELALEPDYTSEITSHGAGALGSIAYAATLVESGAVDFGLCVTNEANALWTTPGAANASWEADPVFESPTGVSTPALYGQVASRLVHDQVVTSEQAAAVAVHARRWGSEHPDAWAYGRDELTVDDVLASPTIASPFRLLDCAPWYPGGIGTAVLVCTEQAARDLGLDFVHIAGNGLNTSHERLTQWLDSHPGDRFPATGARAASRAALRGAGQSAADLDIVQTSAPFTYVLLALLMEMGIVAPDGLDDWIASGGLGAGAAQAINTSGGYLGFGQVPQGLYLLTETIDQLRGAARGLQVDSARRALVHGHGGILASHTCLVLEKE